MVVKSNGHVTWKWLVGAMLGTGMLIGGSYVSMRVEHAVLAEQVAGNKREQDHNNNLQDGVIARHNEEIKELSKALHRIEIRQAVMAEMAPRHIRDRLPPVPEPEGD
jgi:hypothetical protein